MMNKTGTKEWAETNINIQVGCENGCRYCYARDMMVRRFKKCTPEQWLNPCINQKKVDARYLKYHGWVMFPSSHDITPRNLSESLCVLHKLLDAGNQVLITTKARWACVPVICEAFNHYKEQILWRFTIGSTSDDVLAFWEPNAPSFNERLNCLRYAYYRDFPTSVSCEPFLDAWPVHLYEVVKDYITDSFWLGLLRDWEQRVNLTGASETDIQRFVEPLKRLQADDCILPFVGALQDKPFVTFKDSIREIIEKHKCQTAARI